MNNQSNNILFIVLLVIFISAICLFNYIVDPYYIFRDSTIKGFNNVKIHKYTNKRTILYPDMKINHKGKEIAFTGNCLLSHYGLGLDNIGFFTIPMTNFEEVSNSIKTLHKIAPNIKKIYLGTFFDELWSDKNEEIFDYLPDLESTKITYNDIINLFFSWNTTKYSIETVIASIKNKGEDIVYIYPYREIAKKNYDSECSFETINRIKEISEYTKNNGIDLVIYYSPIHVTKKIHIFEKGQWNNNQEFKKRLAEITDYYDYSLFNEYNYQPLDENSKYFIDNIHPTNIYNNIVVNDILTDKKEVGILITKDNVDEYTKDDTGKLNAYINKNKELTEKIKNVNKDSAQIKIKKSLN